MQFTTTNQKYTYLDGKNISKVETSIGQGYKSIVRLFKKNNKYYRDISVRNNKGYFVMSKLIELSKEEINSLCLK